MIPLLTARRGDITLGIDYTKRKKLVILELNTIYLAYKKS